jgi:hypothetical protein
MRVSSFLFLGEFLNISFLSFYYYSIFLHYFSFLHSYLLRDFILCFLRCNNFVLRVNLLTQYSCFLSRQDMFLEHNIFVPYVKEIIFLDTIFLLSE